MYNAIIPYDSLTYGQPANFVSQEALNLCSLAKVNATIKKDFKSAKKELGSFCAQYGYDIPLPPSARHKKFHEYKKKESNKKIQSLEKSHFLGNLNIRNIQIKNIKHIPLKRTMEILNVSNVAKRGI